MSPRRLSFSEKRRARLALKFGRLDRLENRNTMTEPISITGLALGSVRGLAQLGIVQADGSNSALFGLVQQAQQARQGLTSPRPAVQVPQRATSLAIAFPPTRAAGTSGGGGPGAGKPQHDDRADLVHRPGPQLHAGPGAARDHAGRRGQQRLARAHAGGSTSQARACPAAAGGGAAAQPHRPHHRLPAQGAAATAGGGGPARELTNQAPAPTRGLPVDWLASTGSTSTAPSQSHGISSPWQPAARAGGGAALPPRGGSGSGAQAATVALVSGRGGHAQAQPSSSAPATIPGYMAGQPYQAVPANSARRGRRPATPPPAPSARAPRARRARASPPMPMTPAHRPDQ